MYNINGYQLNNKHDANKLEKQLKNQNKLTKTQHDKIIQQIIRIQSSINIQQEEIYKLEKMVNECLSKSMHANNQE